MAMSIAPRMMVNNWTPLFFLEVNEVESVANVYKYLPVQNVQETAKEKLISSVYLRFATINSEGCVLNLF